MIATDMISMAYDDRYDVAYLLSADGDFTPVVKKIKEMGRTVFIASPSSGAQLKAASGGNFILLKPEFFIDLAE